MVVKKGSKYRVEPIEVEHRLSSSCGPRNRLWPKCHDWMPVECLGPSVGWEWFALKDFAPLSRCRVGWAWAWFAGVLFAAARAESEGNSSTSFQQFSLLLPSPPSPGQSLLLDWVRVLTSTHLLISPHRPATEMSQIIVLDHMEVSTLSGYIVAM